MSIYSTMKIADGYTECSVSLPKENCFCNVLYRRHDGKFVYGRMFYRAKPKKEYYKNPKTGKPMQRVTPAGWNYTKNNNEKDPFVIIAWKREIKAEELAEELIRKAF